MLGLLAAQEGLDDAHWAAAARTGMLGAFWRFGRGVEGLDGIDGDERRCKQVADARDIAGTGLAGEEAVVADAVEALRRDMHQEAADELVRIERHLLVSLGAFDTIVLPLEGDTPVVEGDQAAVGDRHPMGVTREIAQHFGGAPEWAFGI